MHCVSFLDKDKEKYLWNGHANRKRYNKVCCGSRLCSKESQKMQKREQWPKGSDLTKIKAKLRQQIEYLEQEYILLYMHLPSSLMYCSITILDLIYFVRSLLYGNVLYDIVASLGLNKDY